MTQPTEMADQQGLIELIVRCLTHETELESTLVTNLVTDIIMAPTTPSRATVEGYQTRIQQLLPDDRLGLVLAVVPHVHSYIFESNNLTDICGAYALVEWLHGSRFSAIWDEGIGSAFPSTGVLFTSVDQVLALAPIKHAHQLAQDIERMYLRETHDLYGAVVVESVQLLELKYGRLSFHERNRLACWVDEFLIQWNNPALRDILVQYYSGTDIDPTERFFRRKTVAELVFLLQLKAARRLSERDTFGERRYVPFEQVLPWVSSCTSSGIRPSVLTGYEQMISPERPLSLSTARKRYVGQLARGQSSASSWYSSEELGWEAPSNLRTHFWPTRWESYLRGAGAASIYWQHHVTHEKVVPPADLSDVGVTAKGMIGLLHIRLTERMRALHEVMTNDPIVAVVKHISASLSDMIFEALANHLTPQRGTIHEWVHPFVILSVSGGEALFVVPGHAAPEIILEIVQQIARYPISAGVEPIAWTGERYCGDATTAHQLRQPMTAVSAGMLIAPVNTPVPLLATLADELLQSSEAAAKMWGCQGTIDFHVLRSIANISDRIETWRRRAMEGHQVRLTARPYTWPEFAGIQETVRQVRRAGMSRSVVNRLRIQVEQGRTVGPLASSMEYLFTRTRLPAQQASMLLQAIEQDWRDVALPPWRRVANTDRWETIWLDVADLFDVEV